MKCPNCGADITGNKCEYCGYTVPEADSNKTINITNNYFAQDTPNHGMVKQKYRAKYRSNTWLWVLGWIFIFPVPLTILMLRNKEIDKKTRDIIIAVAWIVYVLFVVIAGSQKDTEREYNDRYASESTTEVTEELTTEATTEKTTTAKKKEKKTTEQKTTEATEEATTEETTEETKSASNTDVIKFMDEYEAFIDKYVEFMQMYNQNPTDAELISQYSEILTQYNEFSKAAMELDEDAMTDEEAKYYLDSMTRINNKLLSVTLY